MKQTAVEWLKEIAKQREPDKFDWQQAKEMEKQQHKETWFSSTLQFANESEMLYKKDFEQYFNEKFKNK